MLNTNFAKNFTEYTTIPEEPQQICYNCPTISDIEFTSLDVLKVITKTRCNIATGPDEISCKLLKGCAPVISMHLTELF